MNVISVQARNVSPRAQGYSLPISWTSRLTKEQRSFVSTMLFAEPNIQDIAFDGSRLYVIFKSPKRANEVYEQVKTILSKLPLIRVDPLEE